MYHCGAARLDCETRAPTVPPGGGFVVVALQAHNETRPGSVLQRTRRWRGAQFEIGRFGAFAGPVFCCCAASFLLRCRDRHVPNGGSSRGARGLFGREAVRFSSPGKVSQDRRPAPGIDRFGIDQACPAPVGVSFSVRVSPRASPAKGTWISGGGTFPPPVSAKVKPWRTRNRSP